MQGAVQGTLMGVRGLCNGLGPALFGLMFYLSGINIVVPIEDDRGISPPLNVTLQNSTGPPANSTAVKDLEEVLTHECQGCKN